MRFSVPSLLGALALLAGAAWAGPAQCVLENPRASGQELTVDIGPWYCEACRQEGRLEGDMHPVTIRYLDARKVTVLMMQMKDKGWFAIQGPNFKILSTLKAARVRMQDSQFAAIDLQNLKKIFPNLPVGPVVHLTAHQRAHLYHVRLERLMAHFRALTGNREPFLGMGGHFEVALFTDKKEFARFAKELFEHDVRKEQILRQFVKEQENIFVFATAEKLFKGREHELNTTVIHQATHMMVNGHHNFFTDAPAWLEEGFACYYGRRESTRYTWLCTFAGHVPSKFLRGSWEKRVRHAVARKQDPSLSRWCDKLRPRTLSDLERLVAWSYVDWLMQTDPVRLARLVDLASDHERKPTATKAIEVVYGVSPEVLHERWREWVLKTYK